MYFFTRFKKVIQAFIVNNVYFIKYIEIKIFYLKNVLRNLFGKI